MNSWNNLSMKERADVMKLFIDKGIYDLDTIRNGYNKFAEGGSKKKVVNADEQYYNTMEKVAEDNYQKWGFSNPDEALLHALNNNTYNYRGYYNKYPNGKGNAVDHWPDEFKTVYHPTFSNESIYSGKKSQYNPLGLPGGFWSGDTFIPMAWQLDANKHKFAKGGDTNPYTVGATVDALYTPNTREEFLGEPSHHYDFTQSEEWANAHGYYPDARGHRDDRVKKISHPSHPSRGTWNGDKFELTDLGMQNPNYTLFGLADGGQDPQAVLTYQGGIVLPEVTVTPNENYFYNPYDNIILHQKANGGKIHIKPSKRGTFTAAASKHDMGVQEFASKVLANKEDYSSAMVRKANFARNASKWKHAFGGNLFDGTSQPTQQMQLGSAYWKQQARKPIFTTELAKFNKRKAEESRQRIEEFKKWAATKGKGLAEKSQKDYLTTSNDNTWVENRNPMVKASKPKNPHLTERSVKGAKAHRAWEEEHPVLNTWENILGAVPFAVASAPLAAAAGSGIAALGDAAAATSAGQAAIAGLTPLTTAASTSVAGAPLYTWADSGLSSLFGAHGIQTAIDEGGISPTTALEIAPLGRLVKPMWDAGKQGLQYTIKGVDNATRYALPSYDLYRTVDETPIINRFFPTKSLYRADVYKGGEIKDLHNISLTTDPKYAEQYGEVTPYLFESNSIAKAKEPLMGYRDPVNNDMFIYRNTKDVPGANAIVGHDLITGEFPYNSKGTEIISLSPDNIYPKPLETSTIEWTDAANATPEITHFYHGSPVRFDAFSADFIGSGEGGSKVMRGINLWPEEKIANAPKFANIKSPDAPLHLGVSNTPLGGELNPTVYDVSGRGLKLYTTSPRGVKRLSQSDLISQGYDGIQTPNQVTVFPESIGKLSIDKQSSIEDFIMSHPEVERWTPWTTDTQKMQNIKKRKR